MDLLKIIHIAAAALSISGFVVRGIWMLQASSKLQLKWVRVIPHVNDSVLLLSAIFLALRLHQYPLTHDWLTAKLVALLFYIGLGIVALRTGKTRLIRVNAFVAALGVFIYIVAVAVTRNPIPF